MGHLHDVAIKEVATQLVNMLTNDIIYDNGTEPFEGWCADGEVFDHLHGDYYKEAMALMKEIAPLVDNLVYRHLKYGY